MPDNNIPASVEAVLQKLDIYRCYMKSRFLSNKHSSYFLAYEELLGKYRNKPITFVEIGVLNGGSLFMWRDYFGPGARIIGIDLNPGAKKWEKDGFEIYIGSQSDPAFWDGFFAAVGDVDVMLDDGGHSNEQQIVTASRCIPHIKNGGMLLVEDCHTSYFGTFGNPSAYSFINYAKHLVDAVNARFPDVGEGNAFNKAVYSVGFFESIVSFNIDRDKCFVSSPTSNGGLTSDAEDYRFHEGDMGKGSSLSRMVGVKVFLAKRLGFLRNIGFVKATSKKLFRVIFSLQQSASLKKYFE